jgi:hypothetical protein
MYNKIVHCHEGYFYIVYPSVVPPNFNLLIDSTMWSNHKNLQIIYKVKNGRSVHVNEKLPQTELSNGSLGCSFVNRVTAASICHCLQVPKDCEKDIHTPQATIQ